MPDVQLARAAPADLRPAAVRWLRASCLTGALVDALAAGELLSPRLLALAAGLADPPAAPGFRYARGTAAALMLGWTGLLLWAARRPMERRGVLGLTIAVVLGLALNEAVAVSAGFLPRALAAGIWALQAALVALFGWSLAVARRAERRR